MAIKHAIFEAFPAVYDDDEAYEAWVFFWSRLSNSISAFLACRLCPGMRLSRGDLDDR
jgi:hypothetical protein